MRPARKETRTGREAVVLFRVGDTRFALSAASVEEICDLQQLKSLDAPTLRRVSKVRHTFDRRGHRIFVVDANLYFAMLPSKPERVLIIRGSASALLVGAIDRMHEISAIHPLPRAFNGDERRWYRGLALMRDGIVPVLDPASILTKPELAILESGAALAAASAAAQPQAVRA